VTNTYLLDTSVLITLLRGRGETARANLTLNQGRLAVSTISVTELEYGLAQTASGPKRRLAVETLLGLTEVLAFDRAAAAQAGQIRSHLAQIGTPIGPFDSLIAGHARSLGLVVVTVNVGEFQRVPGIQVENWLM
jgi:tRNA(fMet)-specific endonuclease VapC